jgi:hypothetical protein
MTIKYLKYTRFKDLSKDQKLIKLIIGNCNQYEINKKNAKVRKDKYQQMPKEERKKIYLKSQERIKNKLKDPISNQLYNVKKLLNKLNKEKLEYVAIGEKIPQNLINDIYHLQQEKQDLINNKEAKCLEDIDISKFKELLHNRYDLKPQEILLKPSVLLSDK